MAWNRTQHGSYRPSPMILAAPDCDMEQNPTRQLPPLPHDASCTRLWHGTEPNMTVTIPSPCCCLDRIVTWNRTQHGSYHPFPMMLAAPDCGMELNPTWQLPPLPHDASCTRLWHGTEPNMTVTIPSPCCCLDRIVTWNRTQHGSYHPFPMMLAAPDCDMEQNPDWKLPPLSHDVSCTRL